MVEAVNRPKIYSTGVEGGKEQPFTLVELMHGIPDHPNHYIRRGTCYVEGVRHINQVARALLEMPDFVAFRYDTERTNQDVSIPGFLATREWCARVSLDSQRIIIMPTRDHQGSENIMLSGRLSYKVKMGPSAHFLCRGGMAEALVELHYERDYHFDSAKFPSNLEEVKQKWAQQKQNPDEYKQLPHGLITARDLSLNQVLQIISQKPVD